MKFKNLNVNWKRIAALFVAGTMMFSLSGCGKNEPEEEITVPYIETVDERISEYLVVTLSYTKAREVYDLYPTVENLEILKDTVVTLNEKVCDKICEKLDKDFFCTISGAGDTKYVLYEEDDKVNAYTHEVTADGKSYGEINSQIILDAYRLVFNIPKGTPEKWSEEDIKKFIKTADSIKENAKDVFLTDFEIMSGSIYEVQQDTKKYAK